MTGEDTTEDNEVQVRQNVFMKSVCFKGDQGLAAQSYYWRTAAKSSLTSLACHRSGFSLAASKVLLRKVGMYWNVRAYCDGV